MLRHGQLFSLFFFVEQIEPVVMAAVEALNPEGRQLFQLLWGEPGPTSPCELPRHKRSSSRRQKGS